MADLTQIELENLRHIIGTQDTMYQKLNTYSAQCVDPQIKQMFTKGWFADSPMTEEEKYDLSDVTLKIVSSYRK